MDDNNVKNMKLKKLMCQHDISVFDLCDTSQISYNWQDTLLGFAGLVRSRANLPVKSFFTSSHQLKLAIGGIWIRRQNFKPSPVIFASSANH